MHTFRSLGNLLLDQTFLDSDLKLLWAAETIAHRRESYVEGKTHHELAVRDVTATLNNIIGLNLKGSRVVNLLEVAREVASMIVLPLKQTRDLVSELRVRNVSSSFVHRSLI